MKTLGVKVGAAILLVCAILWPCTAGLAADALPADADASSAAATFADAFRECRQSAAEAEFLRGESERLAASRQAASPAIETLAALDDAEIAAALAGVLCENYQPAQSALEKAAKEMGDNQRRLCESWPALRACLNAKRTALFEGRSDERIAGQLAFLMNVDNRWFWLFGLVAVATLAAMVLHDRRHEIRRRLNGGRARAMGLARILYVLLGAAGPGHGRRLSRRRPDLSVAADDRRGRCLVAAGSRSRRRTKRSSKKRGRGPDCGSGGPPAARRGTGGLAAALVQAADVEPHNDVFALRAAMRDSVGTIAAGLNVQTALAEQLRSDADDLLKVQKELTENARQLDRSHRKRHWIRVGLGVGLLGLVAAGGGVFQFSVRRRREKIRNTCPQCLGEGTFEPVDRTNGGQVRRSPA